MRKGIYILNEGDIEHLNSLEISDKIKEVFFNAYSGEIREDSREWTDKIVVKEDDDAIYGMNGINYP